VFEQYDSMVQTNTVQGPGAEAGVMRIKGTAKSHAGDVEHGAPGVVEVLAKSTPEGHAALHAEETAKGERGLAMALAGNGRWCYLDPKLGAMHAVAEAARKVACTGATPVAATNCLNFGNPEKPDIMAQLSAAIDGIAEACTALGTPVTGGNVSLYNETKGEGIYPTPVLGVVGIIDDVTKSVPAAFQKAGDSILLLSANAFSETGERVLQSFGSSDYAKTVLQSSWGKPPRLEISEEAELHKCLITLASQGLLHSASDISDGGLAVGLAKACFTNKIGATVSLNHFAANPITVELFAEEASVALISCAGDKVQQIMRVCDEYGFVTAIDIGVAGGAMLDIFTDDRPVIAEAVSELKTVWSESLESQLAAEVVTA
jgi:phosphoribosylformylglycinamidine synthase